MAGVVVVAGVFEPGSVVTLTQVLDERVLRPEGGDVIAQRIVDDSGNVGWDDLEIGARYFVSGYVNGTYVATRAIGTDAEAPDSPLSQPPIQPVAPKIGTQEAPQPDEAPLIPEEHQDLPVGVPDGVSTGVLEPPPDVSTTEPLYTNEANGEIPDVLELSDRATPQEGAADGSTKASQPLYKPTSGTALDPIPDGFARYEGVTQSAVAPSEPAEAPAPAEPVETPSGTFTDTGSNATTTVDPTVTSEPSSPASDASPAAPAEPAPVAPDVAPPTQPVPSESAGTGDQAGAPSEPQPPAPQDATPAAPSEAAAAGTDAAPAPAADAPAPVAAPESPSTAAPESAAADATAAPDAAQPATPATDGGVGAGAETAPAPADKTEAPAPIIREDPLPGAENAPASLAGNPAVDAPADVAPAAPAPAEAAPAAPAAPDAAPAAPDAQPAAAPAAPDAPPQAPSS